jgi:hypothetical protein
MNVLPLLNIFCKIMDSKNNLILHICWDSTFNNIIVDLFESVYPDQNIYIMILDQDLPKFSYRKDKIKIISRKEFLKLKNQYKYVFIHSLYENNLWACSHLKNHIVFWGSWGSDISTSKKWYSRAPPLRRRAM